MQCNRDREGDVAIAIQLTHEKGQHIKLMKMGHERYQIIDFLVFRFHSKTPF